MRNLRHSCRRGCQGQSTILDPSKLINFPAIEITPEFSNIPALPFIPNEVIDNTSFFGDESVIPSSTTQSRRSTAGIQLGQVTTVIGEVDPPDPILGTSGIATIIVGRLAPNTFIGRGFLSANVLLRNTEPAIDLDGNPFRLDTQPPLPLTISGASIPSIEIGPIRIGGQIQRLSPPIIGGQFNTIDIINGNITDLTTGRFFEILPQKDRILPVINTRRLPGQQTPNQPFPDTLDQSVSAIADQPLSGILV